jgi:hypothetical protein
MAFEVLYPDTNLIADLSATPTTKSTLNSSGLEITDGTNTATLSKSTLELAVSGGMSSFASSLGVDINGFTMNEAQLTMDYVAVGMSPAVTTTTGVGGFKNINQTTNEFARLDSLGVAIYDTTSSLTNVATFSSSIITGSAGAISTVDASQLKVESTALETVITPASVALGVPEGASVSISSADGVSIQSGPFQPDELWDISGNGGDAGQYLIASGSGGAPVWTTVTAPGTPNLASVLAVATAGNADNQPISDLSSLAFHNSLSISDVAGSIMSVNTPIDETTARAFQRQYLPIQVLLNQPSGPPVATTVYLALFL